MLEEIGAEVILANLLQSRKLVTVRDLNEVESIIEQNISGVYVDVTRNCIIWATDSWPDLFNFAGQSIYRCDGKEWTKEWVDEFFNWRIPIEARDKVIKILHDF